MNQSAFPGETGHAFPAPPTNKQLEARSWQQLQDSTIEAQSPTYHEASAAKVSWLDGPGLRAERDASNRTTPPPVYTDHAVGTSVDTEDTVSVDSTVTLLAPSLYIGTESTCKHNWLALPRLATRTLSNRNGHYPESDMPPHPDATLDRLESCWEWLTGREVYSGHTWASWVSFITMHYCFTA